MVSGRCIRAIPALAWVSIFSALPLSAQYFGQNKVRYKTQDFKVLHTSHFAIYYYDEEKEAAHEAGRMAERWYSRLSRILNHELPPEQPIIFYANSVEFRSTTVVPDFIGEGTGGLTEALRRRVVLPFAGPLRETDHVLGHELVHAFQYDITTRAGPMGGTGAPGALRLPLWFVEGMAEYLSLGPVDPHTAMWMRDAVRREEVPSIDKLDNPKYFPYRYGQALWAYIGGRYGDETIGRILLAAGKFGSAEGAITKVLNVSLDELSNDWKNALNSAYEPVLQNTQPPEQKARPVVEAGEQSQELNVSPAVSPDGSQVIFFSERSLFAINLYLADAKTGKIIRKLTEAATDAHLDSLEFINSSGAWSRDGRFAYPEISVGRPQLIIYNVQQDRVERKIKFKELGQIFDPAWSPDGRYVVFSAIQGGLMDLYIQDLQTGNLRRATNDAFAELQPAWSPDGKTICFVTDRFTSNLGELAFGGYRLALLDVATGKITEAPVFQTGKNVNPRWAPDGASLYFVSDRDGISNIYRVELSTERLYQVTNLRTGVSGITALSTAMDVASQTGSILFSAFDGNKYSIFRIDEAETLAGTAPGETVAALNAGLLPPAKRSDNVVASMLMNPAGAPPTADFPTTPYRPSLALDYIAPPSVFVGASNFGSLIGGGTALYWSDLLGFHNLMTAFQTSTEGDAGNFLKNLSAIGAYQNQKHRWTWGFIGGQIPFLTGAYGTGTALVDGEPAFVEQTIQYWQIDRQASGILAYPFSRAQRLEFSMGYQNVSFSGEQRTRAFSAITGDLLIDHSSDLPTPGSLNMGFASTALVYDTSVFGGTSPIMGQRYRLEIGAYGGTVSYSTVLADYRRYFRPFRYLTIAGRLLHFGRYGGGSEDQRLQDFFIGYPSLVRGYDPGSFSARECGPPETTIGCPIFERLFGSRIAIFNAEARIPLFGFLGVVQSRSVPPVEIAPFFDAGEAWTSAHDANFLGGDRRPVSSFGASLRFNILGFAVGQLSYVHPNNRPLKSWLWEFSLVPGF